MVNRKVSRNYAIINPINIFTQGARVSLAERETASLTARAVKPVSDLRT
jgi:hypothetical protein